MTWQTRDHSAVYLNISSTDMARGVWHIVVMMRVYWMKIWRLKLRVS
jgi:hypothetical protein